MFDALPPWFLLAQWPLAILSLLAGLTYLAAMLRNAGAIARLDASSPDVVGPLPKISLIAPARNEARNIEAAMRSLLTIDYEPLQITIINDRSTDATGEILRRLAADHPRLNVVDVTELPAGWLGKNHAMHLGASRSDGEWLLFTDADILFHPSTLRRAIASVTRSKVDHLAAMPDVHMPSGLLNAFMTTFVTMFTLYSRPWLVSNPRSKAHIGIGAFNFVRADAYRTIGGHEPIRMRPDDDMKLGMLLKKNSFRTEAVNGSGLISVEWYATVSELIVGLEKNSFAGIDYSVPITLFACGTLLLFDVWPFIAVLLTSGIVQILFAAAIVCFLAANAVSARQIRLPLWTALLFPITIALFVYIVLRSMVLTLRYNGIRWRDTHYPLAELRANRL